jgi:hypothetical protein
MVPIVTVGTFILAQSGSVDQGDGSSDLFLSRIWGRDGCFSDLCGSFDPKSHRVGEGISPLPSKFVSCPAFQLKL